MAGDKYFSFFTIMVLAIIGTLYLSTKLSFKTFRIEIEILIVLILLAGISLYGIGKQKNIGFFLAVLFFGAAMINFVYLYTLFSGTFWNFFLLLVLTSSCIYGFFFAIERIGEYPKGSVKYELRLIEGQLRMLKDKSEIISKELKSLEQGIPEVIIEKAPPKKKTSKQKKKSKK